MPGGLSPSKQFAVVVYTDKEADQLTEKDDDGVYLMDARLHSKIGPLEEVDASGGSWGKTTENISADWSSDSHWLAVTYRMGRRMRGFVVYEIVGRRAIPVDLPSPGTHPKGKVYDFLTVGANPGCSFTGWLSKTSFAAIEYGLRPNDGETDYDFSKFGLGDFDGKLELIYQLSKDGQWVLEDIRVPKDHQ